MRPFATVLLLFCQAAIVLAQSSTGGATSQMHTADRSKLPQAEMASCLGTSDRIKAGAHVESRDVRYCVEFFFELRR